MTDFEHLSAVILTFPQRFLGILLKLGCLCTTSRIHISYIHNNLIC